MSYPDAETVMLVLVLDNLNTHGIESLTRGVRPRQSVRPGPTAGDPPHPPRPVLLNIAEIELSTLTGRCLDRGIGDLDTLNTELAAWQKTNLDQRQVDWQFTAAARIKLRHLYPEQLDATVYYSFWLIDRYGSESLMVDQQRECQAVGSEGSRALIPRNRSRIGDHSVGR